ncbi:MAG: SpoIID/LytB domain-containing protein [Firmicutes bacterium]|nr:SpoIID/LytB domain-containing protein [Bacillota bacterium]
MRKALIIIVLLLLTGLCAYLYVSQAKAQIASTMEMFIAQATAGNEEAARYLQLPAQDRESLLAALRIPGLWKMEGVTAIRVASLRSATAQLALTAGGTPVTMPVKLVRREGRWQIAGLPELVALPVAIVEKQEPAGTVFFSLADGRRFTLQADAPLEQFAAGFVVGVGGRLVHFAPLEKVAVRKMLALSGEHLEGEETGQLRLAENTVFLQQKNNTLQLVSQEAAIPGMKGLTLYRQDGLIRAVLLPESYRPDTIRVLLKTTGFESFLHAEVRLTITGPFLLEDKVAGKSFSLSGGERLVLRAEDGRVAVTLPSGEKYAAAGRMFLLPQGGGRVRVESLRRGSPPFTPEYRGHMEIAFHQDGLLLVNELPLEEYLYSVVPSEMPVSFGAVPLAVQAVTARSYAVAAILRSSLRRFSAHVDDSVSSQVYNNVPENSPATSAVEQTVGLVVTFRGGLADTRFFSTSAGVTANASEVWSDQGGNFPGTPVNYLVSQSQLMRGSLPDVSTEDGARAFFTRSDWVSYDSASPWFRWQVTMSRKQLEAVLNRYLPERAKAQPNLVLTKKEDGFVAKQVPENPLGELLNLRVIRRGAGGNLMELEITGTKGTYRLVTEYVIRFTLRPVNIGGASDVILRRHDGSSLANYSILPSAFAVFDLQHDQAGRLQSITIYGGGNGHGAGMSQYGARGMADAGFDFHEILLHYYPGCSVENLAEIF